MVNEAEIRELEAVHKDAVRIMFSTEHKLERLYTEQYLVNAMYARLVAQGVFVQITEGARGYHVTLHKSNRQVVITDAKLAKALLDAQRVWVGDRNAC